MEIAKFTANAMHCGFSRKYSSLITVILGDEMQPIFSITTYPGANNIHNSFYVAGEFQSPVEVPHPHNKIFFSLRRKNTTWYTYCIAKASACAGVLRVKYKN